MSFCIRNSEDIWYVEWNARSERNMLFSVASSFLLFEFFRSYFLQLLMFIFWQILLYIRLKLLKF
jgi:hypothetical protein